MKSTELLAGSVKTASYNIIYQIGSRVLTFLLNAFTIRYVSPEVLGVINVRLTLLYSTVLFVSREAFRRACLGSAKASDRSQWTHVLNLVWIVVPNSIICSLLFGFAWTHLLVQPEEEVTSHYVYGVVAIGASCVIEMVAAPANIAAQAFFFVKLQVLINTAYILVRALSLCVAAVVSPRTAVLAYGIGHVLAATMYTLSYYVYFWWFIRKRGEAVKKSDEGDPFPFKSVADFLPRRGPEGRWLNPTLCALTWSFFKQGLLKQLLTEGERYVMTIFDLLTFLQQGTYDVVANLSSMVVRFVFLPVEDSAYYYFAQMVQRDKPLPQHDQNDVSQVSVILKSLLRFMSVTGLIFVVFGHSYSHLLLRLYGGPSWAQGEGPSLLRAQCLCVLFLALNGVTEAYVFACMSQAQLNRHNRLMVVLSALFLLLSWLLTRVCGSLGFVLANCCNMLARISHGIVYMRQHFQGTEFQPWTGVVPTKPVLASLLIAAIVNHLSEVAIYPESAAIHLLIGGGTFSVVLATVYLSERETVAAVVGRFMQQKKKQS